MPDTIDQQHSRNEADSGKEQSSLSRWLWFIGLYCAGLLAVFVVAWFFRALLGMQ